MLQKQFRLPARYRLPTPSSYSTSYFLLRYAKNDLPLSRFGFVIGKRIDKRATERNRLRRALSSEIEEEMTQIKPGYDMLIIVRREAVDIGNAVLRLALQQAIQREELLK